MRPTVHVSIDVPDLDAGVSFYVAVFGFVELSRPFPTMAVVDGNNVSVCLHERASGSVPAPTAKETRRYERHWTPVHLDLHVPGFDDTLGRIRESGGHVEQEVRSGRKPVAFCSDPFGNGFCVIGEPE